MPSVADTVIGDRTLGRTCRLIMRRAGVPMEREAMTNSRSFSASTSPRTIRAVCIQEVMPMTKTISMNMPVSGPEGGAQRIAEQHDDDQQKRQKRQRQEQIGEAASAGRRGA